MRIPPLWKQKLLNGREEAAALFNEFAWNRTIASRRDLEQYFGLIVSPCPLPDISTESGLQPATFARAACLYFPMFLKNLLETDDLDPLRVEAIVRPLELCGIRIVGRWPVGVQTK